MGDLGLFARRPSGWLAGHALPHVHRTSSPKDHRDDGESVIDLDELSVLLDADWEVRLPGQEPYVVRDVGRRAPLWVESSMPLLGKGRRSWSMRLRQTRGLLAEVGVPCLVAPDDPTRLWLDWDAAYDLHVIVWDRSIAVEQAIEQRRGGIDAVVGRILRPLRPTLHPADQPLVDAALAAEAARAPEAQAQTPLLHRALDPFDGPPDPAEYERVLAQVRRTARLHETGTECPATVTAIAPTGHHLCGTPEHELHLDVDDRGTIRRLVHREVMGDRWAGQMAAGTRTLVCLDPADPDGVALARPERLASRIAGGRPMLQEYGLRHERITLTGRWASAVVVSSAPTGGRLHGLPEWAIELDVTDGGVVRRVTHREPLAGRRPPWTSGLATAVRIDPDDPAQVTFA